MSLTKPIVSGDVKLSRDREKTIELFGYRWVIPNSKLISHDSANKGEIKFLLLQLGILNEQFNCKMNVRAFYLKMDIPGKHVFSGESDRRFTNIVEKKRFFEKVYDLDDSLEKEFVLDFNTLATYQELLKNPNFDPVFDLEVFVKIILEPTKETWKFLMTEFQKDICLESSDQPHDIILIVGEKKLYVQTQILTTLSGYFKTLLTSEYLEKNKAKIEIKDVDSQIFHDMVKMMYHNQFVLGASNVIELYEMADFFEVPCVFDVCSAYLADKNNDAYTHMMQYIKLADKHKDGKLLMVYFGELKRAMGAEAARGFVTHFQSKFRELSKETQNKLLLWLNTRDPLGEIIEVFKQMGAARQ